MNVLHSYPQRIIKKNVRGVPKALLTNKTGNFLLLEQVPTTRYSGFFWYANSKRMMRIFEHLFIVDEKSSIETVNIFYGAKLKYKNNDLSVFLPTNSSSMVLELRNKGKIGLTLDVKDAYDNREWGRHYEMWEELDCLVVKFTKKTNSREDQTHEREEYSLYIAIHGQDSSIMKKEWMGREYSWDKERNSSPSSRYVFLPAFFEGKKIVCSVSWSKDAAIKEAKTVAKRVAELKQKEVKALTLLKKEKRVRGVLQSKVPDASKMAFLCALSSLDRLIVHSNSEVFAGLPWFFQHWARDSLISSQAITLLHPKIAQSILEKNLGMLKQDGTIETIPGSSGIKSVDALGWFFKRLSEMNYSVNDSLTLKRKTTEIAEFLLNSNGKDMLRHTHPQETWMDTAVGGGRQGARIEIQAGMLCMFKAASEITGNGKYKTKEKQMAQKIKKAFWNGKILFDGAHDPTVRPNVFIAAYLYPELLSKEEWETCFENSLKALWLPWGGLSTIDKSNPLFKNEHTGESPESYHHGDSWYWINNLAATVMARTNKQKFKAYIDKILAASSAEILWMGAVGSHAEVSSAKEQQSSGCLSQAWSNAMFVELCQELSKNSP